MKTCSKLIHEQEVLFYFYSRLLPTSKTVQLVISFPFNLHDNVDSSHIHQGIQYSCLHYWALYLIICLWRLSCEYMEINIVSKCTKIIKIAGNISSDVRRLRYYKYLSIWQVFRDFSRRSNCKIDRKNSKNIYCFSFSFNNNICIISHSKT